MLLCACLMLFACSFAATPATFAYTFNSIPFISPPHTKSNMHTSQAELHFIQSHVRNRSTHSMWKTLILAQSNTAPIKVISFTDRSSISDCRRVVWWLLNNFEISSVQVKLGWNGHYNTFEQLNAEWMESTPLKCLQVDGKQFNETIPYRTNWSEVGWIWSNVIYYIDLLFAFIYTLILNRSSI